MRFIGTPFGVTRPETGRSRSVAEDEICIRVILRLVAVDENESAAAIVANEACGWIDRERRAADDQNIGLGDGTDGAVDARFVQTLFIEHDLGLDEPAAIAVRNALVVADKLRGILLAAALAAVAVHRAVELVDAFASRLLMQAVDVLRDDGLELSFLLELCQSQMRGVGFGL